MCASKYQRLQTEIVGRYPHYQGLRERGEKLISQKHFSTDEIRRMVDKLEIVWNGLNDNWDKRKQILTQLYDLQVRPASHFFIALINIPNVYQCIHWWRLMNDLFLKFKCS